MAIQILQVKLSRTVLAFKFVRWPQSSWSWCSPQWYWSSAVTWVLLPLGFLGNYHIIQAKRALVLYTFLELVLIEQSPLNIYLTVDNTQHAMTFRLKTKYTKTLFSSFPHLENIQNIIDPWKSFTQLQYIMNRMCSNSYLSSSSCQLNQHLDMSQNSW